MAERRQYSSDKRKDEAEEKKPSSRKIILKPEEKAKRGRWVTIAIFLLTFLLGYLAWK
jgi:hypothetical protein